MYLVFDPATRRLRFANAGHPPALVIGAGTSTFLEDGLAPPVGVTVDAVYTEASRELSPGTTLLLYTDGLVERRERDIDLGTDELVRLLKEVGDLPLDELCDRVLQQLFLPDAQDDVAVLAVRLLARP
jgi:serine phosphatase RsbU (regulator of sigma subunit)